MSQSVAVTARVYKLSPDGVAIVRLDRPVASTRFGYLDRRTAGLGGIWDQLRIDTPVSVELEPNDHDMAPAASVSPVR